MWLQTQINIQAKPRGVHLITNELIRQSPAINDIQIGLAHFFIQHTSASLAINENADPTVRQDLENFFNKIAPEGADLYRHKDEGLDDMPAHLKSIITGSELTLPITEGRLALGMWQGIYLCEHRDHANARNLILTLQGQKFS